MNDTEKRIDGMTFNEYLNFVRRSWRKMRRRQSKHYPSEEEMEEIKRKKRIEDNWLSTPVSKMKKSNYLRMGRRR